MSHPPICPYCDSVAKLVSSSRVVGRWGSPNVYQQKVWCCPNYPKCDSYASVSPVGLPVRLANRELRRKRQKAHRWFDKLWHSGLMTRTESYEWLAKEMDMKRSDVHISNFDIGVCNAVIQLCMEKLSVKGAKK